MDKYCIMYRRKNTERGSENEL
jgi:hypothetical protein